MVVQNAQVIIIWVAFVLMVILCSYNIGEIVRRQLVKEAETSLNFIQAKIEADLQEPQTLMLSISETIRGMIQQGYDSVTVQEYIKNISGNVIRNETRELRINGLYGFFDAFGGAYFNDGAALPPGYVPVERPWYKAAVGAEGEVALTQPYQDARTGNFVLSCVRRVFDDEGTPLCVLSLDVPLDRIAEYVVSTRLADGGYGLLLDEKLYVIAHPDWVQLGKHLRDWDSGLAGLAGDLEKAKSISGRRVQNYQDIDTIVYIRGLKNQWFVGIVTPYEKYNQDVFRIRMMLMQVGFVLAVSLSFIFLYIISEKSKADIKNRQKSNFLARMSHDIRTPMNAILGITEIQLQDETLPKSVSEALIRIHNSSDMLLGIINDILDMSKIEAGKLELMPVKYDVPSLIYDTVQLNALRFESKPIDFKLSVDENVPLTLIGDELRIKQILNNLLSNAFKYTEKGEVSFSVTADYVSHGGSTHIPIIFRVSDTGQGMTAEQIRNLGDEYSRFNLEANRMTEGTGLGMNITLKLIHMMNGGFSVESKQGKGTEITVRLPQRNASLGISGSIGKKLAETLQTSRIQSVSHMNKVQITRTFMPYGKVLVVDDSESNLYVARGLMAPYGLSIDTATSGFEAIDKIRGGAVYDIIFMDHMMPKMDGIETVNNIRGMGYRNPIIALTANALVGQAEMFMERGFDGFISKPIDIRQLNASLNKMIRDRYPAEVVEAARRQMVKVNLSKPADASDPKLAAMFVLDAEKALNALNTILIGGFRGNDDVRQYVVFVHSMKSAFANIGETRHSAAAFKLEQAGKAEDIAALKAGTPAFLETLREAIDKYRQKEDAGPAEQEESDEARAYLSEKLLAIETACGNYDTTAVNRTLAELVQKKWPRPVRKLLDTLSEYLLNSDFEEAAKLAKDYEKNMNIRRAPGP
jgi:signal transduction histidine kinase/CheY-like chemotaxis protein